MSTNWGYILVANGRPSEASQKAALTTLGIDCSEFGPVFIDEITTGSTRPRGQLVERNALLEAVQSGDTVYIAAPFCIGLSANDADWFLGELQKKSVTVIINGDLTKIEPSDDRTSMVERVGSAQNVFNATKSRNKRKSK